MAEAQLKAVITAEDKASGVFKNVGGETNKLSLSLGKLIGIAGGLMIFSKLTNLVRDSIAEFGNQEKAMARLGTVMRTVNGATDEEIYSLRSFAEALQMTTTFADEQIESAMAMLGTFQLSAAQIRELTPRILDMGAAMEKASGTTTDLESITIAVGKAMTSGIGSLSRYGVTISDTQKKMFELADKEEKVVILTEALDNNFKGVAEGIARTYAGQLTQFSNMWGELKEQIGEGVMPAIIEVTGALSDVFTKMNEGRVVTTTLTNVMGIIAVSMHLAWYAARQLGIGLAALWTTMERRSALKDLEKDLGKLDVALEAQLLKGYDELLANLGDQLYELDDKLRSSISRIAEWGTKTSNVWDDMAAKVKESLETQSEAAKKAVAELTKIEDKLKDIQKQEKENTSDFIKSEAKRSQSFRERLTDMVYEAEQKRMQLSDEIGQLEKRDNLSVEEIDKLKKLKEEVKKYYSEVAVGTQALGAGAGLPGALSPALVAAAERGDIQRAVEAYRAEQAGATLEFGEKQEALVGERATLGNTYNFNFSGANIADKDKLIQSIIDAVNRADKLTAQGAK